MAYDRKMATEYALKWALSRNPQYFNYDELGGDCTNFISQCLYAGTGEMNYRGYGWYYINANQKSPSWTGVRFLYDFLVNNKYEGPQGQLITRKELELGDLIQLSFIDDIFGHSLIVTSLDNNEIRVCAHTIDSKNRLLETYEYEKARFIKIK